MKLKSIALGIATTLVSAGVAVAAQQGVAAKKLLVSSPPSGNKTVVYLSKNNTATVVGDPTVTGATFTLALTPGGTQCATLPASGWTTTPVGFKYKDPQLANGPVKVALIKQTPSGNFLLKVIEKSSQVTPAPGNPTATYATSFEINGGDQYCSSTGTSTPKKNDEKKFLVNNDNGTACTTSCGGSPSGAFLDVAPGF